VPTGEVKTKESNMAKKISKTKQWEMDHPDDVKYPAMPDAAKAWRRKRGREAPSPDPDHLARYNAAMKEKQAAK
jgi:hypothetical protein